MKRRLRIAIGTLFGVLSLAIGYVLAILAAPLFRIPRSSARHISGEIVIKFCAVGNPIRDLWESAIGHRLLFLVTEDDGDSLIHLYVSQDDYARCHPPHLTATSPEAVEMLSQKVKATFEAKPLWIDGFTPAKLARIELMAGPPQWHK